MATSVPMTATVDISALLTYSDVADILRTSIRSVRRLAASGELDVVQVGARSPRIRPESVAAFIDARTATRPRTT